MAQPMVKVITPTLMDTASTDSSITDKTPYVIWVDNEPIEIIAVLCRIGDWYLVKPIFGWEKWLPKEKVFNPTTSYMCENPGYHWVRAWELMERALFADRMEQALALDEEPPEGSEILVGEGTTEYPYQWIENILE